MNLLCTDSKGNMLPNETLSKMFQILALESYDRKAEKDPESLTMPSGKKLTMSDLKKTFDVKLSSEQLCKYIGHLDRGLDRLSPCNKLNILLDIDETLVHHLDWDTWYYGVPDADKPKYKIWQKNPPEGNLFVVRPHLKEFMQWLFENCTVSLWTLSEKPYAKGVAKNILGMFPGKNYKFAHILSAVDDMLGHTMNRGTNKDLRYTWNQDYSDEIEEFNDNIDEYADDLYAMGEGDIADEGWYDIPEFECFARCNTILIDDLPSNTIGSKGTGTNQLNSITINPFGLFGERKDRKAEYEASYNDDTLLQLLEMLRKISKDRKRCAHKKDEKNIPVFHESLRKRLGMRRWQIDFRKVKKGGVLGPLISGRGVVAGPPSWAKED